MMQMNFHDDKIKSQILLHKHKKKICRNFVVTKVFPCNANTKTCQILLSKITIFKSNVTAFPAQSDCVISQVKQCHESLQYMCQIFIA